LLVHQDWQDFQDLLEHQEHLALQELQVHPVCQVFLGIQVFQAPLEV